MTSTEAAFYDSSKARIVDTGTARIATRRFGSGDARDGELRERFVEPLVARRAEGQILSARGPQLTDCRGFVTIENAELFPHEERPAVVLRHIRRLFAESREQCRLASRSLDALQIGACERPT